MTPMKLHRIAAATEMVTWTVLILGMILKYSGTTEAVMPFAGGIHGFGFLCFVAITVLLWVNNRWSFGQGIAGLAVSIVPWAAWPYSLWAERRGLLDGSWRFQDPAAQPHSLPDKILAQFVRHPLRSGLVLLVVVAIVFSLLLAMGQPYDPEAIAG
ncbi:hypothetical protein CATRI_07255 [Corynebacterium atrinae]|uniref:DUF3817 domain-containing protein n=1 Tax=Corynebacterium atrinae TaxID=1336740 RepID=UPI0025B304F9|nr:DUF3817 domain-containing protein [Corynebacterium atrinae]WJY63532.1 hypothetical protein CATRI_07255 [Corynebacterium atrinae]